MRRRFGSGLNWMIQRRAKLKCHPMWWWRGGGGSGDSGRSSAKTPFIVTSAVKTKPQVFLLKNIHSLWIPLYPVSLCLIHALRFVLPLFFLLLLQYTFLVFMFSAITLLSNSLQLARGDHVQIKDYVIFELF